MVCASLEGKVPWLADEAAISTVGRIDRHDLSQPDSRCLVFDATRTVDDADQISMVARERVGSG